MLTWEVSSFPLSIYFLGLWRFFQLDFCLICWVTWRPFQLRILLFLFINRLELGKCDGSSTLIISLILLLYSSFVSFSNPVSLAWSLGRNLRGRCAKVSFVVPAHICIQDLLIDFLNFLLYSVGSLLFSFQYPTLVTLLKSRLTYFLIFASFLFHCVVVGCSTCNTAIYVNCSQFDNIYWFIRGVLFVGCAVCWKILKWDLYSQQAENQLKTNNCKFHI